LYIVRPQLSWVISLWFVL